MSQKKIIQQIRKSKRFLITTHVNMEADALGSVLAMREMLTLLKKTAVIVSIEDIPEEYRFLPGLKNVKKPHQVKRYKFDTFIALDCSDTGRCREVIKEFAKDKMIMNIDHHVSNSMFGDANWVDPQASSTVEMVYRLYKQMPIPFDKNSAIWLYSGLLTDTGSFRYTNTNVFTHKMAAELLGYGLSANKIYRNIYQNLKFQDMKLLSEIFRTLRQEASGQIVWFEIPKTVFKKMRASFDLGDQVLNFGRLSKEAKIIVLFKENLGKIKEVRVNFRSNGEFDVNKLAKYFGGGGHPTASGATMKGSLESVKSKVLKKIRMAFK